MLSKPEMGRKNYKARAQLSVQKWTVLFLAFGASSMVFSGDVHSF